MSELALPLGVRGSDGSVQKLSAALFTDPRVAELLEEVRDRLEGIRETDRIGVLESRIEALVTEVHESRFVMPTEYPMPAQQLEVLAEAFVRAIARLVVPRPAVNVQPAEVLVPPFPTEMKVTGSVKADVTFPSPVDVQKVELVKAADVFPALLKIDDSLPPKVKISNVDELATALEKDIKVAISGGIGGGGTDMSSTNASLANVESLLTEILFAQDSGTGSYIPVIGTKNTATSTTLITPAAGKRLRCRRIWVKAAHSVGDVAVEFELKLGSMVVAHDEVIGDQPYADGVVKVGTVGVALTLELLSANKVFYNIAIEEVD